MTVSKLVKVDPLKLNLTLIFTIPRVKQCEECVNMFTTNASFLFDFSAIGELDQIFLKLKTDLRKQFPCLECPYFNRENYYLKEK